MKRNTVYGSLLEYFFLLKMKDALASAFLFTGNDARSNELAAQEVIKMKYCQSSLYPCPGCASCGAFKEARNYDLFMVDASPVKKENIRSIQEFLRLRSLSGSGKAVYIKDIDLITEEAANSFLKLLEEPPASSLIIATTTRKDRVIPTINSRFKKIYVPHSAGYTARYDGFKGGMGAEYLFETDFSKISEKDRRKISMYVFYFILLCRDALVYSLTRNKDCLLDNSNYEIISRYFELSDWKAVSYKLEMLIRVHGDLNTMNVNLAKNIVAGIIKS